MKKQFTFGIFLFLLLGFGSNMKAATFTAVQGGAWNAQATWFPAGTDTTTKVLPTSVDSVSIPAGFSVYLQASGVCKSINIAGELKSVNAGLTAYADIYVAKTGVMAIKSNFYCANIYNYGKVWCWNTHATGSPKTIFVGYNGSSAPGTGDYTILNDSIFGDYRSSAMVGSPSSVISGSGIYINYSNIAKSLTIRTSGKTTGYSFAIGAIYPAAAAAAAVSQDFNLNIKESIALLKNGSVPDLTLHNGDVFAGFNRTCTIFPGDTVFINGGFHMKNAGAPTASAGNMTYNVYGCLDLASLKHPSSSANELDLYTTTFAGSTNSLVMNIGDGTANNPGTLVIGKTVNLIKALAGQTLKINLSPYSIVKFGYSAAATTINCTTAAAADNTLFPATLYNMEIATGTNGITLPASLRVKTALTLTSGKVTLGNYNLTAASLIGGSATSYAITSGTGALTLNASTSGTLYPIGTATGYAPVTITPASNDTVAALVSSTATGSYTGYAVNANEWTLTPQVATTAALAFTPTTATNTTSPAIFSGSGYAAKADAALAGSTYSASGFSLGTTATIFATGGTTPATAIVTNTTNNLLIYTTNNSLVVRNAKVGDVVSVYGISGVKVASSVVKGENTSMTLTPGVYIVKTGSTVQKVSVL